MRVKKDYIDSDSSYRTAAGWSAHKAHRQTLADAVERVAMSTALSATDWVYPIPARFDVPKTTGIPDTVWVVASWTPAITCNLMDSVHGISAVLVAQATRARLVVDRTCP